MRVLALLAALVGLALPVAAQAPSGGRSDLPTVLRGMGPDPRDRVDIEKPPWRAVGKLQTTVGGVRLTCTGALIGPATVLTAAHCLYNPRTQSLFPADAMHFLIGFDREKYDGVAGIVEVEIGPGYDPDNEPKTRGSDWAVLRLDQKLGTPDRLLTLGETTPAVGDAVMVGGYSRDYPLTLTADLRCRILARGKDANGRPLLLDDCTAKQGSSGAPVLVRDGVRWVIVGVDVATARQDTRGIASVPPPGTGR